MGIVVSVFIDIIEFIIDLIVNIILFIGWLILVPFWILFYVITCGGRCCAGGIGEYYKN